MVYAGFWRRFLAYLIDGAVLGVGLMFLLIPIGMVVGGVMAGRETIAKHQQHSQLVHKLVPLAYETAAPVDATPPLQTSPAIPIGATPEPVAPVAAPATQPVDATSAVPAPAQVPAPAAAPSYDYAQPAAPIAPAAQPKEDAEAIGNAIGSLVSVIFYPLLWFFGTLYHTCFLASRWQATPGKRVMGCMVVTRDGQRLSYLNAFGRHLACAISWVPFFLPMGYFIAGWTSQKTALHDLIAGTRVVRTQAIAPVIATR